MTKTPEEWLDEVSPKERTEGILKLFLGYAPGVGKTFSMLSEAIRRRSRGEDVVIGVIETHGRKGIAELASQLERVPMRKIEYKGTVFEEMDAEAIMARKPAWFWWTNSPTRIFPAANIASATKTFSIWSPRKWKCSPR